MKNIPFSGLKNINVELTSRCNKDCWMCGRRRIDKDYPDIALQYGDMDFDLVKKISLQLPPQIVVQLHNNGEPLLYPRFGEAVKLFSDQITNIVSNGKLLLDKSDEIIGNLDTLAISIIENDPEADEQYRVIEGFLKKKGDKKPFTIFRLNGKIDRTRYEKFGLPLASRLIHSPLGSFNYRKAEPTIPEIGICLDFLHHMAINRKGRVSLCVRFDPKELGVIGDANTTDLADIWSGPKRMEWLSYHKRGERNKVPLCSYCHYWGVPTSGNTGDDRARRKDEDIFNNIASR
ncbi:MAG TPA: SPASM domain-containing protein [Elusimicrobiota bacterium]|nr:SPASM domain-containing protein [Elusimicrobiota bacterium]